MAGRLRRCSAGGRWCSLPWPPLPAPRSRCFRIALFAARSVLVRTSVSSGMLLLTWPAPFLSRHSCVSAGATCPRCGAWLSACAVPTLRDAAGPRGQDLPRGPAPLSLIGPGRQLSLLCGGLPLFRVVVFSSISPPGVDPGSTSCLCERCTPTPRPWHPSYWLVCCLFLFLSFGGIPFLRVQLCTRSALFYSSPARPGLEGSVSRGHIHVRPWHLFGLVAMLWDPTRPVGRPRVPVVRACCR